MYETSAYADEWLSPLTMDSQKIAISAGSTLHLGEHWKVDGVIGHMFMPDRVIRNSKVRMPVTLRSRKIDAVLSGYRLAFCRITRSKV